MATSGTPDPASEDALQDDAFRAALLSHSAGDSMGFLLWHATLQWQREIGAALGELDLTYPQFGILGTTWWLSRTGDAPYQRQVAEHSGIGEVMTSQMVRTLERKELLTREPSPTDVRAKCLTLTPLGRDLAERAVVAADAAEQRFFGDVDDPKGLLHALRGLARRTGEGDPA